MNINGSDIAINADTTATDSVANSPNPKVAAKMLEVVQALVDADPSLSKGSLKSVDDAPFSDPILKESNHTFTAKDGEKWDGFVAVVSDLSGVPIDQLVNLETRGTKSSSEDAPVDGTPESEPSDEGGEFKGITVPNFEPTAEQSAKIASLLKAAAASTADAEKPSNADRS